MSAIQHSEIFERSSHYYLILLRSQVTLEQSYMEDPLRLLPIEKWVDLQGAFKSEWPRGITGYKVLETQRAWIEKGYQNGCKMYCPYGDIWNGFVAINIKQEQYEVIIQCPTEDTSKLEEALNLTKLVDWTKIVVVPFAPPKIIRCVKSLISRLNMEITLEIPCFCFVLDRSNSLYDISIPPEITFGFAKREHIDLFDSTWPHRYPSSSWFFEQMIQMDSGYALYKNNNPISWLFTSSTGMLTHLYVVEEERNKGYAQLIMKLVSNNILKDNKDVLVFCLERNTKSYNLLIKLGLKQINRVSWLDVTKTVT
ncbi:hypothetical protein K1T71_010385 [Dendrolimus kikuchii]|uniref:Uncharacterized protein n=1 Tax=Dendrolimus kikuchii TaxID=765133 RepID=A0ACC1CRD2_9NEOP|nr:hypothetical protein K1T71_010385 [Dendrolimus kikuchii]